MSPYDLCLLLFYTLRKKALGSVRRASSTEGFCCPRLVVFSLLPAFSVLKGLFHRKLYDKRLEHKQIKGGLDSQRWGRLLVKCVDAHDGPSQIYSCFKSFAPKGAFPSEALLAALPQTLQGVRHRSCLDPLPADLLSTNSKSSEVTLQGFPPV